MFNQFMYKYKTLNSMNHNMVWLSPFNVHSSAAIKAQSCAAAILMRYFPVISWGRGVVPGQGTWPSTSQMHSFRQYFLGPKLAGLDASILARASICKTSLKKRRVVVVVVGRDRIKKSDTVKELHLTVYSLGPVLGIFLV